MSKKYDPLKPRFTTLAWMLGPSIFLLSVYLIWPIIESFRLSLFDWNGLNKVPKYIGMGNWNELIHDSLFWLSVRNSFILLIIALLVEIPLGLGLAILLYRGGTRFRFFKMTYFFPGLMSTVAIAILFKQVFDYNYGLLNQILQALHLDFLMQDWLGDKKIAIFTVAFLVCWQYTPYYMLLFLAAFNGISTDVEEASAIDGATNWKFTRHIQVPLIRGAIITAITLITIGSLKYFDLIWVLTGGGPESSTEVMASYLYQMAFKSYRVGYASTVASALFLIVFLSAIIISRLTRKMRDV
jgi:raffinose/stachyose/melibiose transport system permease protein